MYLTVHQCKALRELSDAFEVALRSLVADTITNNVDINKFNDILKTIGAKYKLETSIVPVHTEKFRSKATTLLKSTIFQRLELANQATGAQSMIEGDTLYVGELADLILLFYNPLFRFLGKAFPTQEHFLDLLENYHIMRNGLSHPASAKIYEKNVEKTFSFITTVIAQTPARCFWFCSKTDIQKLIEGLRTNLAEGISIKVNWSAMPTVHSPLLMRDDIMLFLGKLFFGETQYSRTVGSVELHGYGGVGKTAIALEFCHQILKRERDMVGSGYSFILWLSSKNEELKTVALTGGLRIQKLIPTYSKCADIITQLNILLGLDKNTNEHDLSMHIVDNNLKGLVVVDNLENISTIEKTEISNLINRLPHLIQFLITSRNYEKIGNAEREIKGFFEIEKGREFIQKYLSRRGPNIELPVDKIDLLVDHSCGNILILVLCIERLIEGKASLDSMINELQVHKRSEIDIITDFMYKNTFQSIIDEVKEEGFDIDFRKLIGIMFIYNERIDFHSLRELIEYENSQKLEKLLSMLVSKFIIVKSEGYYELHEFAQKYVVLKFLPDDIQTKEMIVKIKDHKDNIIQQLSKLYDDKKTSSAINVILEDWKALTEIDTLAIAMAYSEHEKVNNRLSKAKNGSEIISIIDSTKSEYALIEARSFHPYIKFQKARIYKLFLINRPNRIRLVDSVYNQVREIVSEAYYQTYFLVTFGGHSYVANTESYASFLWLYGMHLQQVGQIPEAVNILEEATTKFSCLKTIRNPSNAAKAHSALTVCYAITYLKTQNDKYLNKIKNSVSEAFRLNKSVSNEEQVALRLLLLFSDVFLNSYRVGEARRVLIDCRPYPNYLRPITSALEEKLKCIKIN